MINHTQPITIRELYEDLVKNYIELHTMNGTDEETARKKANIFAVRNTWILYHVFKLNTDTSGHSHSSESVNNIFSAGEKAHKELFGEIE